MERHNTDPGKTNYIIAAWSGDRRLHDPVYKQDRTIYLERHLEHLSKISHDLDQVTIVVPDNPTEPPGFAKFLEDLPATIGQARIVWFRRPNRGLSYGSFSDAFKRDSEKFDWWIFNEDDYLLLPSHFDSILQSEFTTQDNCGYVCPLVLGARIAKRKVIRHAGICSGITSKQVLEEMWNRFGCLPHSDDAVYQNAERKGQVAFTGEIERSLGYTVYDLGTRYSSAFVRSGSNSEVRIYHPEHKELFAVPIQHLYGHVNFPVVKMT